MTEDVANSSSSGSLSRFLRPPVIPRLAADMLGRNGELLDCQTSVLGDGCTKHGDITSFQVRCSIRFVKESVDFRL